MSKYCNKSCKLFCKSHAKQRCPDEKEGKECTDKSCSKVHKNQIQNLQPCPTQKEGKQCTEKSCTKIHTSNIERNVCPTQLEGNLCSDQSCDKVHIKTSIPHLIIKIKENMYFQVTKRKKRLLPISKSTFTWINKSLSKPDVKISLCTAPSKDCFVLLFTKIEEAKFNKEDYEYFNFPENNLFDYKCVSKDLKTAKKIRRNIQTFINKEGLQDLLFVSEPSSKPSNKLPKSSVVFVIWRKTGDNEEKRIQRKIQEHLEYKRPEFRDISVESLNSSSDVETNELLEQYYKYCNDENIKNQKISWKALQKAGDSDDFQKNRGRLQTCCKIQLQSEKVFPAYQVVSMKDLPHVFLIGPESFNGKTFDDCYNLLIQLELYSKTIELKNEALVKVKEQQIINKFKNKDRNLIAKNTDELGQNVKKSRENKTQKDKIGGIKQYFKPGREKLCSLWKLPNFVLPSIEIKDLNAKEPERTDDNNPKESKKSGDQDKSTVKESENEKQPENLVYTLTLESYGNSKFSGWKSFLGKVNAIEEECKNPFKIPVCFAKRAISESTYKYLTENISVFPKSFRVYNDKIKINPIATMKEGKKVCFLEISCEIDPAEPEERKLQLYFDFLEYRSCVIGRISKLKFN